MVKLPRDELGGIFVRPGKNVRKSGRGALNVPTWVYKLKYT